MTSRAGGLWNYLLIELWSEGPHNKLMVTWDGVVWLMQVGVSMNSFDDLTFGRRKGKCKCLHCGGNQLCVCFNMIEIERDPQSGRRRCITRRSSKRNGVNLFVHRKCLSGRCLNELPIKNGWRKNEEEWLTWSHVESSVKRKWKVKQKAIYTGNLLNKLASCCRKQFIQR